MNDIHQKTPIITLVSGNARGIDTIAESWAKENGITVETYIPDWKKYGRGAAILRNNQMVLTSD